MDQTSPTTPTAPAETADAAHPVDGGRPPETVHQAEQPAERPGFRARGRMRRRARFLRKARELAYRDLGGLVFNLHRFGQRNDALVIAKLSTLSQIDTELRSLEAALREHQPVTVLREAGITACPRCAAIHSGEDHFCPNCGLSVSRQADVPIGAPAAQPPNPPTTSFPAASNGPGTVSAPPQAPRATPPQAAAAGAAAATAAQAASAPAAPTRSAPPAKAAPPAAPEPDAAQATAAATPASAAKPAPAVKAAVRPKTTARAKAAPRPKPAASPRPSPEPSQSSEPPAAGKAPSDDDEPTEILHPPPPGG